MFSRVIPLLIASVLVVGCDVTREQARSDRYLYQHLVFDMPLSEVLSAIRHNEWTCNRQPRSIEEEPTRHQEARISVMAAGWAGERTFYLIEMRQTGQRETTFISYVPPGIADDRAKAGVDFLIEQIKNPNRC